MIKKTSLLLVVLSTIFFIESSFAASIDGVTRATTDTYDDLQLDNISYMAVARAANKSLYCFVNVEPFRIIYQYQTAPATQGAYNDAYTYKSTWTNFPYIASIGPLAAGTHVDGKIYVFTLDYSNRLVYSVQGSGPESFGSWKELKPWGNGGVGMDIVTSNHQNGRLVVFCKRNDNTDKYLYAYTKSSQADAWYTQQIGGTSVLPGSKLAAVLGYQDRLLVFMSNPSGLYVSRQAAANNYSQTSNAWSNWTKIGSTTVVDSTGELVACRNGTGTYGRVFYLSQHSIPVKSNIYSIMQTSGGYGTAVKEIDGTVSLEPYRKLGLVKDVNNVIRLAYNVYSEATVSWVALTHQVGAGWCEPYTPVTAGSPRFGTFIPSYRLDSDNPSSATIIGANYTYYNGTSASVPTFFVVRPGLFWGSFDRRDGSSVVSAVPDWTLDVQENPVKLSGFDVIQEPPSQ